MRSAEDIYKILTSQKANYVIIEESICNELRFNKGCRTKDLLDISNEHVRFRESTSILILVYLKMGTVYSALAIKPLLEKNVIEGHFMSSLSILPPAIQVVYDKGEIYSFSKHGRFCQEIKLNYSPYTNYFTRVFWNRSFHVYKVNSVISFQY